MPNEMIERVGIAIAKAKSELSRVYGLFDYSVNNVSAHVVRNFVTRKTECFTNKEDAEKLYINLCKAYIAKAAIKAMREPTKEMVAVIHGCYPDIPDKYAYPIAADRWKAAIDKALKE